MAIIVIGNTTLIFQDLLMGFPGRIGRFNNNPNIETMIIIRI